jgi:hypothetical protein
MFFIGVNSKFGQTFPGDLRVMTTGAGWLVQLDAGTNGSVDLAIEVMDIDHSIVWDPVIFWSRPAAGNPCWRGLSGANQT